LGGGKLALAVKTPAVRVHIDGSRSRLNAQDFISECPIRGRATLLFRRFVQPPICRKLLISAVFDRVPSFL
jgi:hypothetical protein